MTWTWMEWLSIRNTWFHKLWKWFSEERKRMIGSFSIQRRAIQVKWLISVVYYGWALGISWNLIYFNILLRFFLGTFGNFQINCELCWFSYFLACYWNLRGLILTIASPNSSKINLIKFVNLIFEKSACSWFLLNVISDFCSWSVSSEQTWLQNSKRIIHKSRMNIQHPSD